MSVSQINSLKNEKSLPVGVIREFQMHLDMYKFTISTTVDNIIDNLDIKWNKEAILTRDDIRMIHIPKLTFIEWSNKKLYDLTIKELDKCLIISRPELPWVKEAMKELTVLNFCKEHLISAMYQYPDIKWNMRWATSKVSLNQIVKYPNFKWNIDILHDKLVKNKVIMQYVSELPENLIKWKQITKLVSWKKISMFPDLNWDFKRDNNIYFRPSISEIRKLKNKPFNWKQITSNNNYTNISLNQDIPWDKEIIARGDEVPPWFIREFPNYDWDMKNITINTSWDLIYENSDIKWDTEVLSRISNDTVVKLEDIPPLKVILKYKHVKWNWDFLSKHFKINMIDMEVYQKLPWNWDIILDRPNVGYDMFILLMERDWKFENINFKSSFERNTGKKLCSLKEIFPTDIACIITRLALY